MNSGARTEGVRRMLAAESVAIIGATNDPRKVGYRPVAFLLQYGYPGRIYPVNRRQEECCGLRTYPSLAELPEVPDLIVVVVGAPHVAGVLREAASRGVKSALVLSAGFAELGPAGQHLQSKITEIAESAGMLVIGPNSVGVVHAPTGLTATFSEALTAGTLPAGRVAIISQSGAQGTVMLAEAHARHMGVRTYISSGNEASAHFGDFLGAVVDDPGVRVIGGYVEGIRDGATFLAAAQHARRARKPVVLMKVGRSDRAKSAAVSHTGALVGRDEVYEAAFRRAGVVRARDDQELLDALEAFDILPNLPSSGRVAIVTTSGGAGVLISDLIADSGLHMSNFPDDLQKRLRALLPAFAAVGNPVDMTGGFVIDASGMNDVLTTVAKDPSVDLLIVYGGLGWSTEDQWVSAVREAAQTGTPVIAICPLVKDETRQRFRDVGVAVYASATSAVRTASMIVKWAAEAGRADSFPEPAEPTDGRIGDSLPSFEGVVSESAMKELLESVGLDVPRGGVADARAEAEYLASGIGGSIALKADVAGLVHKSDVGAVVVGVAQEHVGDAFEALMAHMAERLPGARINGVRVEEAVSGGMECLVGVVRAEPFGYLLGVGMGGTQAEILQDMAFDLVPVDTERARQLIASLRSAPLLGGYRSSSALDIEALAQAVSLISAFAARVGDRLRELDVNPLLVREKGHGVVVLDATMTLDALSAIPRSAMQCGAASDAGVGGG